jgi:hypothetical protein
VYVCNICMYVCMCLCMCVCMYVCMCVCMCVCMYVTQHVLRSVIERVVYFLMCLLCGIYPMYSQYIYTMYVPQSIIYVYKHVCIKHPAVEAAATTVFMDRLRASSTVPSTHAPYPSTRTVPVTTALHTTDP